MVTLTFVTIIIGFVWWKNIGIQLGLPASEYGTGWNRCTVFFRGWIKKMFGNSYNV